jgi:hypothetical protein
VQELEGLEEVALGSGVASIEVGVMVECEAVPMVHGEAGEVEFELELLEYGTKPVALPFGEDEIVSEGGEGMRGSGLIMQPFVLEVSEGFRRFVRQDEDFVGCDLVAGVIGEGRGFTGSLVQDLYHFDCQVGSRAFGKTGESGGKWLWGLKWNYFSGL